MGGTGHERGVTVLVRTRDILGGERSAGANLVLDNDRLFQQLGQRLRNDARDNVGAAAGAEADNHMDRPVRWPLGRGRRGRGDDEARRDSDCDDSAFHEPSPFVSAL